MSNNKNKQEKDKIERINSKKMNKNKKAIGTITTSKEKKLINKKVDKWNNK